MEDKEINQPGNFITDDEKTWGMLTHVSSFLSFPMPIIGGIIGPLVLWLLKKDVMPFVDDQGKEVLNFNISVLLYLLVSSLFTIIVIGFVMMAALIIAWTVLIIIGAVRANEGIKYRYPATIRFIK